MILVFFIVIFITFIIMLMFSRLEININKLNMSNINEKRNNKNLIISISIKFGQLCMFKIKMNTEKLANIYAKALKNKQKNNKKISNKKNNEKVKEEIKKLDFKIENLNLNLYIGTEDCVLTSYLIGIISIIISNILPHFINYKNDFDEYKYIINPIYNNQNSYKINLNCIFNVKLVHIIYVIYLFKKGRSDKNERTSNRKSYEYSYE